MKRRIVISFLTISMLTTTVLGAVDGNVENNINLEINEKTTIVSQQQKSFILEGNTVITKTIEKDVINPYNIAKIQGVGESNTITLLNQSQNVILPLSSPLYKFSEVYKDRILCKDGIWGVERNIVYKEFDGSENWELIDTRNSSNEKTTLFGCDLEERVKFKELISSHFQTFWDVTDKQIAIDGISLNKNRTQCNIRFMNMRNVKSVDELKRYLSDQYQNNTPVTILYVRDQPVFEPFDEELQIRMNEINIDSLGCLDNIQPKFVKTPITIQSEYPFSENNTWVHNKEDLSSIGKAIEEFQIYNASSSDRFFIESIVVDNNGTCTIKIGKEDLLTNTKSIVAHTSFSLFGMDFMADKLTDVLFVSEGSGEEIVTARINFSKFKIPTISQTGLTYEETGISQKCILEKELVLPSKIPVVVGTELEVHYNNILLNGDVNGLDKVYAVGDNTELTNYEKYFKYVPTESTTFGAQNLVLEESRAGVVTTKLGTTELIPLSKEVGEGVSKKILFLGDSIVNENYYTQGVIDLFKDDKMDVELIGTRGNEGNRHEGRGGWSAYDYCTAETRYGVPNLFLNNGKFDFSYYMKSNKYDSVDYVLINLGVNDLNQAGHNSHKEIIGNYNKIINSIRQFDPEIKILISMPTILFATNKTNLAKNTRVDFIKAMKKEYDNREEEGLFLVPIYASLDSFIDFKFEEVKPNAQSTNKAMVVSDTSHPAISGYQKMASVTYGYIKYVQSLDE